MMDIFLCHNKKFSWWNVNFGSCEWRGIAVVAPKNCRNFITQTDAKLNNDEIVNINDAFLHAEKWNQLEFLYDYCRLAKQFMYAQDSCQ